MAHPPHHQHRPRLVLGVLVLVFAAWQASNLLRSHFHVSTYHSARHAHQPLRLLRPRDAAAEEQQQTQQQQQEREQQRARGQQKEQQGQQGQLKAQEQKQGQTREQEQPPGDAQRLQASPAQQLLPSSQPAPAHGQQGTTPLQPSPQQAQAHGQQGTTPPQLSQQQAHGQQGAMPPQPSPQQAQAGGQQGAAPPQPSPQQVHGQQGAMPPQPSPRQAARQQGEPSPVAASPPTKGTAAAALPPLPQPLALAWRPQMHLPRGAVAAWQAPALLVSAFWDTRPTYDGHPPRVAVVLAYREHHSFAGVRCAFSSSNGTHVSTRFNFLAGGAGVGFSFQPGRGYCDAPRGLVPNGTRPLHLALVSAEPGAAPPAANSSAWVPVVLLPRLTDTERAARASGRGPIAACLPPLHTDAYAVSLVQWVAWQQLVGIDKVMAYNFNAGPFLQALIDYYARTGYFEEIEWIIPRQILQQPTQRCLLPFFRESANQRRYDSPECTYHQDNYGIHWWGQHLAIMDCQLRAIAQGFRWVVIFDWDEYIVPLSQETLPQMLQRYAADGGGPPAEVTFHSRILCAGCSNRSAPGQPYPVRVRAADSAPGACTRPAVGFNHVLWTTVMSERNDHLKSVVDPIAVETIGVHETVAFSNTLGISRKVHADQREAIKLHDRFADIHVPTTFASEMLPLLRAHVANLSADPAGVARAASGSQGVAPPLHDGECTACKRPDGKVVDFTLCNTWGALFQERIANMTAAMLQQHAFDPWLRLNDSHANLYGGHWFARWGPP